MPISTSFASPRHAALRPAALKEAGSWQSHGCSREPWCRPQRSIITHRQVFQHSTQGDKVFNDRQQCAAMWQHCLTYQHISNEQLALMLCDQFPVTRSGCHRNARASRCLSRPTTSESQRKGVDGRASPGPHALSMMRLAGVHITQQLRRRRRAAVLAPPTHAREC
jgi:hypothetical protein